MASSMPLAADTGVCSGLLTGGYLTFGCVLAQTIGTSYLSLYAHEDQQTRIARTHYRVRRRRRRRGASRERRESRRDVSLGPAGSANRGPLHRGGYHHGCGL